MHSYHIELNLLEREGGCKDEGQREEGSEGDKAVAERERVDEGDEKDRAWKSIPLRHTHMKSHILMFCG